MKGPQDRKRSKNKKISKSKALENKKRILEEIYKSAFHTGEWDRLDEESRKMLRQKWGKELRGYDVTYLLELASPAAGTACVITDDKFNLHFSVQNKRRATTKNKADPLLEFIEEVNRYGKIVHGYDEENTPIITDMSQYDRHSVVIGASGMGKSTYMTHVFCQLARMDGPMILIDPHKSLIEDIIPNLPPHRWKDVVYIDPSSTDRTWGINLLQSARGYVSEDDPNYVTIVQSQINQTVNTIVTALSILQEDTAGYGAGPFVKNAMKQLFYASTEREDTTLVDAFMLLTNKDIRLQVTPAISNNNVRSYFEQNLNTMKEDRLDAVRNKMEPFMTAPLINTFSRRDECQSLQSLVEENKIIVFDLNSISLPNEFQIIGYLMLTLIMIAVEKRHQESTNHDEKPLYIMIDEFRNFASKTTVKILAEARKMGAGLIMGFQQLQQLDEAIQQGLDNASTWCVFRPSIDDADKLCMKLGLMSDGRAQITELTDLPQYEAKLQYDELDTLSDKPGNLRKVVNIRGIPPYPERKDRKEILNRIKKIGYVKYAKVNQASDAETVYTQGEESSQKILEVLYELSQMLLGKPQDFYLVMTPENQKNFQRAQYGLKQRAITEALVQVALTSKGIELTGNRIGQLIRYLIIQGMAKKRKLDSGLMTTELTEKGIEEMEKIIIPDESQNEGGEIHKNTIRFLYQGLSKIAPFTLEVPSQKTNEYTPDLIAHNTLETPPGGYVKRLTEKDGVDFHIEVGTQTRPDKMAKNIARAHKAGREPIIVIPTAGTDQGNVGKIAKIYQNIARLIDPVNLPNDPELRILNDITGKPFRIWAALDTTDLFEYIPQLNSLKPVVDTYAKGYSKPAASKGKAKQQSNNLEDIFAASRSRWSTKTKPKTKTPVKAPAKGPAKQTSKALKPYNNDLKVFKQVMNKITLQNAGEPIPQKDIIEAFEKQGYVIKPETIDDLAWKHFGLQKMDDKGQVEYHIY